MIRICLYCARYGSDRMKMAPLGLGYLASYAMREHGIPAVAGIDSATRLIRPGQIVEVEAAGAVGAGCSAGRGDRGARYRRLRLGIEHAAVEARPRACQVHAHRAAHLLSARAHHGEDGLHRA